MIDALEDRCLDTAPVARFAAAAKLSIVAMTSRPFL